MVAETLTGDRAGSTYPAFKPNGSGLSCVAWGTYEVLANVEDGDIFEMCKVPGGAVVTGGWFYGDDLDTGSGVLDMDVGWAANGGSGTFDSATPGGLLNAGAMPGTAFATGNVSPVVGLIYPFSGVFANGDLPTFTNETTVQVEANVAAGTFTAGAISVVAYYTVD